MFNKSATHKIAGSIFPSFLGGVHTTILLQPAIIAGIACIKKELNKGAVPPGTYRPTTSIGLNSDHNLIPLVVSISSIDKPLSCFS